jgi:hypothetical protein
LRVCAGLALPVLALHVTALAHWPHSVGTVPTAPPTLPRVTARTLVERPAPAPVPVLEQPHPIRTPRPDHRASDPSPAGLFLPASALDRRPTPVSTPDPRWLDALADQPISGLPLRVRLSITAEGQVVGVEPVEVSALDAVALPALDAMFRDTAFLPGRRQGRDVASQIELEVRLDTPDAH